MRPRNVRCFSAICPSRFAAFSLLCTSLFVPVLATKANPPKNRIVASLKISNPRDAVCSPDNQYVYVASNNSNFTQSQVVVISVATHEVISQFDAGAQALSLAISPDGQTLYSIDDNCDIQVISTANQTVTGTISLNVPIFPDFHQNWHLAQTAKACGSTLFLTRLERSTSSILRPVRWDPPQSRCGLHR